MTDTQTKGADEASLRSRWSLLGLGGVLSLCCLFAAPAATGAAGGAVVGSTAAATGVVGSPVADGTAFGGVIRILVSAVTVGTIGAIVRTRMGS